MSPHVTIEIAELQNKTVNQLVQRYEQVFNEECRSRNKQYLIRRIAWRLQASRRHNCPRNYAFKPVETSTRSDSPATVVERKASRSLKLEVICLVLSHERINGFRLQRTAICSTIEQGDLSQRSMGYAEN